MRRNHNIGRKLTRLILTVSISWWSLGAGSSWCSAMGMTCCQAGHAEQIDPSTEHRHDDSCNNDYDSQAGASIKDDNPCCCSHALDTKDTEQTFNQRIEKVEVNKVHAVTADIVNLFQGQEPTQFALVLLDDKSPPIDSSERIIYLQTFLI